ncbi:hypothetical protein JW992_01060 [candidate division KSB1 bacterium]|nr:hypothetical protein [candidate division KSB1 bacterium]
MQFKRILDIDRDDSGNIYVFDKDHQAIMKFDPQGKFLRIISSAPSQQWQDDPIISFAVSGQKIAVQRLSNIDFIDTEGILLDKMPFVGRGTLDMNSKNWILVDRGLDATYYSYAFHVADQSSNMLAKFHIPRLGLFEEANPDFYLSAFLDDTTVVAVASMLDSAYLYSVSGTLLKSASLKNERSTSVPMDFEFDDLAVSDGRIFLLRLNNDSLTEDLLYFHIIEEYDRDLQLVRVYSLPDPITLTDPLDHWYLTYHKFIYFDGQFLFATSYPKQEFVAYKE